MVFLHLCLIYVFLIPLNCTLFFFMLFRIFPSAMAIAIQT